MYATHVELPVAVRVDAVALLQARLRDAVDLVCRIRQAYWNMSDAASSRRELFEAWHDEIDDCIDTLSRRITALSGAPERSVRAMAFERSLGQYPLRMHTGEQQENNIKIALVGFSTRLRADIDEAGELGDAGTTDALSRIAQKLDAKLGVGDCHAPFKQVETG